jgi:hypothetical protein
MDAKGHVWINREFVHTKIWPNRHINPITGKVVDLEKEYKEALAGKLVTVMDIAIDDSGYLVLGDGDTTGHFMWMVEKGDTKGFLPVIKKYGTIIPAGMDPADEFMWVAKRFAMDLNPNDADPTE